MSKETYYQRNREKILEYQRQYRKRNRESLKQKANNRNKNENVKERRKQYGKEYWKRNKQILTEKARERRHNGTSKYKNISNYYYRNKAEATLYSWLKFRWKQVKYRSKRKGIEFDDSAVDLSSVPELCPVLGIRYEFNEHNSRTQAHFSPSFDRINSKLGYVKGNVWVISNAANRMKSDVPQELLIKFAKWVLQNHTEQEVTNAKAP